MPDPSPLHPVAFLYVLEGDRQGDIIKLYTGRNTIGTSEDCSIRLADPAVSPKHASIRFEEGVFTVRDLDSEHGTCLDGAEVVRETMLENQVLRVGDTHMKLKVL